MQNTTTINPEEIELDQRHRIARVSHNDLIDPALRNDHIDLALRIVRVPPVDLIAISTIKMGGVAVSILSANLQWATLFCYCGILSRVSLTQGSRLPSRRRKQQLSTGIQMLDFMIPRYFCTVL